MRLLKVFLIFFFIFVLCSCNNTSTFPTQIPESVSTRKEQNPTSSETTPKESMINLKLSEIGVSIGITAEEYPRIDGSTSTLKLVQGIFMSMFQPHDERGFEGMPQVAKKTIPSYDALLAGELDLIIVPDPSEEIKIKMSELDVELEFIPIGAEALVFVTHKNNPVKNITTEQVRKIYTDMSISNWSEIGGLDGRIVAICRNSDSGSQAQIDNMILEGTPINPDIEENYMERDMNGMLQMVEEYEYFSNDGEKDAYALGYTLYYYLKLTESVMGELSLKTLSFNDVLPTTDTILSKEYPLATSYFAVIRSDTPVDHPARKIANWLLTDDGQWQVAVSGLGALKELY